eukprot:6186285-Pleurochrysis_carterae.AAC.1
MPKRVCYSTLALVQCACESAIEPEVSCVYMTSAAEQDQRRSQLQHNTTVGSGARALKKHGRAATGRPARVRCCRAAKCECLHSSTEGRIRSSEEAMSCTGSRSDLRKLSSIDSAKRRPGCSLRQGKGKGGRSIASNG